MKMNTALVLIASQALAATAALAKDGEVIEISDSKASPEALAKHAEQMSVIMNKNVVKNAMHKHHGEITNRYGHKGRSMYSKNYGDLVDRIRKATSAAEANDSTNLSPSGYVPTTVGSQEFADGLQSTCHGVCHGNCYGSRGWR